MQYTDLLDNPDWFQSFDNTVTPVTSYVYGQRTTVNSDNPRFPRVFANDNPFGAGYCLQGNNNFPESEYVISYSSGNPQPTSANYYDGSTIEFWVKLDSTFNGLDILQWKQFNGSAELTIGITNTRNPFFAGKYWVSNGNLDGVTTGATGPVLTPDEWHLITYTTKRTTKYTDATTIQYSLLDTLYVDGIEAARRTTTSQSTLPTTYQNQFNHAIANGLEYGTTNTGEGMFSNYLPNTIKISNFAFWQNQAQSQKKIARRYMFNKTKKTVKQHTIDSNPYWYQTWDTYDTNTQTFTDQYGSGPFWGITYNSTGADITVAGQEKRSISTVGKTAQESLLFSSNYGANIDTLAATGNWSVDFWVKWDYTKQQIVSAFSGGVKPQSIWFSGAGVASFNIRINTAQNIEFSDRFNNNSTSTFHSQVVPNFVIIDQLTDGDWHHIAKTFSYSAGTLVIRGYFDGVKVAQGTYSVTTPNNPSYPWTGPNFFPGWPYAPGSTATRTNGYYDNYAIYDRTLTDTEIADKYRNFAAVTYAVNHYNGQTWETTSTQKVWDGNDWILWSNASPTQWDGTSWVAI
jgi:hypothetical protein